MRAVYYLRLQLHTGEVRFSVFFGDDLEAASTARRLLRRPGVIAAEVLYLLRGSNPRRS